MVKGSLSWHVVEEAINKEINWLKTVIVQVRSTEKSGCDLCRYTYWKIALLIVTGKVRATEIKAGNGHDLWDDLSKRENLNKTSRHGGTWHRKMTDVLRMYFSKQGFEVVDEPFLAKGRADLGVYKKEYRDLFIEIGTTSLYKLWWNLQFLNNALILLLPSEKYAIEFVCFDKGRSKKEE